MQGLKPNEILDKTIYSSLIKGNLSIKKMILLGFMAGAFIALGGLGANTASYSFMSMPETAGIGRMISGLIFPCGLIMVVIGGGELFTGNCLMFVGVIDKKLSFKNMLINWIVVYFSNFLGAIFVAWIFYTSGLMNTGNGMLGEIAVTSAVAKVSLSLSSAFLRGILCNLLVCLAVWIATGADSTAGKILGMFFPIWLFVTSGFEHSVANMFFIPAGLLFDNGATAALTISSFIINNLIPVTLGNIVGGSIFVGAIYYLAYKKA